MDWNCPQNKILRVNFNSSVVWYAGQNTWLTFEEIILFSGIKFHHKKRITLRSDFVSRSCSHHPLPHLSNMALLCKYQQWALCMLYFSKASATLLTFIYICFQRITFLSYEWLYRPACLNVVTCKFITGTRGTGLKGPICDPDVNKRVASATDIQNTGLE